MVVTDPFLNTINKAAVVLDKRVEISLVVSIQGVPESRLWRECQELNLSTP